VHWTRVGRWLRALEALKIIHLAPGETRKRGGNRSPRYLCRPPSQVMRDTCVFDSTVVIRIVYPLHATGTSRARGSVAEATRYLQLREHLTPRIYTLRAIVLLLHFQRLEVSVRA
jgi:hypothetical protein